MIREDRWKTEMLRQTMGRLDAIGLAHQETQQQVAVLHQQLESETRALHSKLDALLGLAPLSGQAHHHAPVEGHGHHHGRAKNRGAAAEARQPVEPAPGRRADRPASEEVADEVANSAGSEGKTAEHEAVAGLVVAPRASGGPDSAAYDPSHQLVKPIVEARCLGAPAAGSSSGVGGFTSALAASLANNTDAPMQPRDAPNDRSRSHHGTPRGNASSMQRGDASTMGKAFANAPYYAQQAVAPHEVEGDAVLRDPSSRGQKVAHLERLL